MQDQGGEGDRLVQEGAKDQVSRASGADGQRWGRIEADAPPSRGGRTSRFDSDSDSDAGFIAQLIVMLLIPDFESS